jgi:hypothetical protein
MQVSVKTISLSIKEKLGKDGISLHETIID